MCSVCEQLLWKPLLIGVQCIEVLVKGSQRWETSVGGLLGRPN